MGERVDLDEVSLDMARYAQPDMEGPFVEFLLARLRKWQPDLVVPIGSPAGRFVAKYRQRLFPRAPVLYTGMDRRTLPANAFESNATFVGESFDLAGLVEDILQLAPDTNHIAVVIGASPLERYWTKALQEAFQPFTNRVRFTWFNDLSFDEMLRRAAALPPNSFMLHALLLRDASGVTHNQDEALQQLRAVANAPINGLYQNQLGLGLVGGRLYQAEVEGDEAARVAIRILRGEPISTFPPRIIGPQPHARYDWRELQRWKISEARLPPGSVVEFRQPTIWERYRWWIAGVLAIGLLQAVLIVQLGVTLAKRRRMERALGESEERLNLAALSSGTGLWSLDLDTGRVLATPRLRELFEFSPSEELTYEAFLAMIHPEDRERVRQAFRRAEHEEAEIALEFRVVRADGSVRWIGTWGHRNDDRHAKTRRWSGASTDVTERKQAEERLRESESRFRTVADSAPVLIWMSGVDKLCTFFNKPWLAFTGRTLEQEMGNGWIDGVHPDDAAACGKGYVEAFDARRPFVLQYRLRRHDGEYRWLSDHGVPRYDAQGGFAGYIGSCIDITERLRTEAETQSLRHELAHISRLATMGELTAAIVHEVSQPLSAIMSNAQAGLRSLGPDDASQAAVREILTDIVADDRRARQIIQNMRALFQKGGEERRPLPLNALINEVASMVVSDALLRNVTVTLDLAPDVPLVSGNRVQMQQVVLNLVMNALDAVADVVGQLRTVVVRTRSLEGRAVEVEVADSGPGIAPAVLASLFEPFITTKRSGMGMGLSVSRSIVSAHDGKIWAENNPGGGATFHVTLPAIVETA